MNVVRNGTWAEQIAKEYQIYEFWVIHTFSVFANQLNELTQTSLEIIFFLSSSRNHFCNLISNLWVSSKDKSPIFRN